MLDVHPFWDRLHLAYQFESERKYRLQDKLDPSQEHFEPGEIAYAPWGLTFAYFDFLESRGYRLTRSERALKKIVRREQYRKGTGNGKYCLVLRRIDDANYLVCYLTTFHSAFNGANIIDPIHKFFAVAFGETSPWPPGVHAFQTIPRWNGKNTWLFGCPVVRRVVRADMSKRFRLGSGELNRLLPLIANKIQLFSEHEAYLRAKHMALQRLIRVAGGFRGIQFVAANEQMVRADSGELEDRTDSVAEEPEPLPGRIVDCPNEAYPDKPYAKLCTPPSSETLPKTPVTSRPSFKYRFHYLESSESWQDIQWPLRYLMHDICLSSPQWSRRLRTAAAAARRMRI